MRKFVSYKKENFKGINFNTRGIFLPYEKLIDEGNRFEKRDFDFELFYLPSGIPLLIDLRDKEKMTILDLRPQFDRRNYSVKEVKAFAEDLMQDILDTEEEMGLYCPDYNYVDMKAYSEIYNALQKKYGKEHTVFKKQSFRPEDFKEGEVHDLLQKYFKGYIPEEEQEAYYMEHIRDILEDTDKHTENFENKVFPFTDEELIGFAKTFSYLPEYLNIERNE